MIDVIPMKHGMNDARKVHKIWNEYNPDNLMPEKGFVIHHKDGNHKNNNIDNLQKMTKGDHFSLHNIDRSLSEETKRKLSEVKKGRPQSEIHKKHLSENHADFSGENHPFYGKHHSKESNEMNRQKHLGKTMTEQQKKEQSIRITKWWADKKANKI
jgi:hypothetical protein